MTEATPIKVSVLATGQILLDGQAVTLADLDQALQNGAAAKTEVWYHRENPGGAPPPVVADVMKLITTRRLPLRLSAKPDFSDAVAPAGILEQNFAAIRQKAGIGQLVVARPDGRYLLVPVKAKESMAREVVAAAESILPSAVKRNVAVIGETSWAAVAAPTLQAANQAIPFFGHLLGFATIGHAVWIFQPRDAIVLNAGCRDAEVLIVDSECQATLPANWQTTAAKVMRNPQILVHDRSTYRLRKA